MARVILYLLIFYLLSYVVITRWGNTINHKYNVQGPFYVPAEYHTIHQSNTLSLIHGLLSLFYYPINRVDGVFFPEYR